MRQPNFSHDIDAAIQRLRSVCIGSNVTLVMAAAWPGQEPHYETVVPPSGSQEKVKELVEGLQKKYGGPG